MHNGPGSGPDIFGRTVAQAIEQEKLAPVRFQVANKVGGGGVTAANYMVERKGDAHVLALFTSVWMTNPLVQKAAEHKVVDMTPISRLVIEPAVIVVRADSPFKTLQRRHRRGAQGRPARSSRPAARRWRATRWCASC